jgi:hypothetical protein
VVRGAEREQDRSSAAEVGRADPGKDLEPTQYTSVARRPQPHKGPGRRDTRRRRSWTGLPFESLSRSRPTLCRAPAHVVLRSMRVQRPAGRRCRRFRPVAREWGKSWSPPSSCCAPVRGDGLLIVARSCDPLRGRATKDLVTEPVETEGTRRSPGRRHMR